MRLKHVDKTERHDGTNLTPQFLTRWAAVCKSASKSGFSGTNTSTPRQNQERQPRERTNGDLNSLHPGFSRQYVGELPLSAARNHASRLLAGLGAQAETGMTSPREIREANEHEYLLTLLPDALRDGVIAGTYEVLAGKQAKKPVVRNATTKALVKGSGQYLKSPDGADVGRATGYKQRVEYREAMQAFIPVLANVPAGERQEVTRSFESLLDAAYLAAQGVPTRVECEHEDEDGNRCRTKHIVAFKPDGNLLWRLIENLVGKATETKEIDLRAQVFQQIAERRVTEVRVLDGVSEDEQRARRDIISAAGITDIETGSLRHSGD